MHSLWESWEKQTHTFRDLSLCFIKVLTIVSQGKKQSKYFPVVACNSHTGPTGREQQSRAVSIWPEESAGAQASGTWMSVWITTTAVIGHRHALQDTQIKYHFQCWVFKSKNNTRFHPHCLTFGQLQIHSGSKFLLPVCLGFLDLKGQFCFSFIPPFILPCLFLQPPLPLSFTLKRKGFSIQNPNTLRLQVLVWPYLKF